MQEHPTSQLLEEYNRRQLSPDVFLVIHRHVSACPACRELGAASTPKIEDYNALLSAFTASPTDEPYHLSPAEISAYVKEALTEIDRENAESHLEVCEECAAGMEAAHAAAARSRPITAVSTANLVTSDLRPHARVLPGHLFGRRAVQLIALAAVAGLVLLLALFLFRAENDNPIVRQPPAQNSNSNANQAQPPLLSQGNQTPAQNGNAGAQGKDNEAPSPSTETGTPPEAAVVQQLTDGGQQIILNKEGEVKGVERLPARLQQTIKALLLTQRLERSPQSPELNGKPGTLLGESGDGLPFRLVSPLGKVVSSNRPTFRWRSLAGADSYTVTITDARLNVVATSAVLTAVEWKPPAGLKAGVYSWQVTAMKDGQRVTSPVLPAPQAKFRVLEQDKLEELARARRTFAGSHLALGVLFTQAGLLDEAEREFQLLLSANPHSPLARKLLAQVQAMQRGR